MKNKRLLLIAVTTILGSCNDRYPLKVDFKQGVGSVIGREKCSNSGENAWMISLSDSLSQNVYGAPITYKGFNYKHVVKVYDYDLSAQYVDSSSPYLFEFYESKKNQPECNADTIETYDLPNIEIKTVDKLIR